MDTYKDIKIPVYVITLNEIEGSEPIINEFSGRTEFCVKYITSVKDDYFGSYKRCIDLGIRNDQDVLIICTEFHRFTTDYNRDTFIQNLITSHNQNCDILCGSVGGINRVYPINRGKYWIDTFSHCNFMVIYKKFYQTFINISYKLNATFCDCISKYTMNKMVLYPFVSMPQTSISFHDNGIDKIYSASRNTFEICDRKLALYSWVFDSYLS